jgi:hypothetical protein
MPDFSDKKIRDTAWTCCKPTNYMNLFLLADNFSISILYWIVCGSTLNSGAIGNFLINKSKIYKYYLF